MLYFRSVFWFSFFCANSISCVEVSDAAYCWTFIWQLNFFYFNPLYAELNPIRHLLALVGAYHILHISRIRVKQGDRKGETVDKHGSEQGRNAQVMYLHGEVSAVLSGVNKRFL